MKQLLEGVYNLIEPQTMEKNIEFTREFVISEEWVTGDSLHLNQVLINLLGNAVKIYAPGRAYQAEGRAEAGRGRNGKNHFFREG